MKENSPLQKENRKKEEKYVVLSINNNANKNNISHLKQLFENSTKCKRDS